MSLADFPGIQRNVPLKGYSTLGVGGLAEYFCRLSDVTVLPALFEILSHEKIPYFILGGGSNVLFPDEGFRGLVLKMENDSLSIQNDQLIVDAGVTWPKLIKAAEAVHLVGWEPFNGLPGTLGGAVVGNAGCFGKETAELVESVRFFDLKDFRFKELPREALHFGYRTSFFKTQPALVIQVTLRLSHRDHLLSSAPLSPLMRLEKQPPGKSSGSFFKNPSPDQPAGRLIDQCGLKGFSIGGAQISPKHANFFMNMGNATATDFLALRDHVKKTVHDKFGIVLKEEVVMVMPMLF
jgi:UDP-N-acetylmuramate dehydrogenase